MVFCGESIITEISVYVSFYMSEFIIQSTFAILREKRLYTRDFLWYNSFVILGSPLPDMIGII